MNTNTKVPTTRIGGAILCICLLTLAACSGSTETVRVAASQVQIGSVEVNPDPVRPGDAFLFTVEIGNQTTVATAFANLTTLGGVGQAPLFDNGTNGDLAANDRIWSRSIVVPAATANGRHNFTYEITNNEGSAYTGFASIGVDSELPSLTNFNQQGQNLTRGGAVVMSIQTDPATPIASVTLDTSSIGGGVIGLSDAGLNGDVTAGDSIWSIEVDIPLGITVGGKPLPFTATSTQGKANTYVGVVTIINNDPVIDVAGTTIQNAGGQAEASPGEMVEMAVSVNDPDGTISAVTANLSVFGLSAAENLVLDFTDGKWKLQILIPSGTLYGTVTIPYTVIDSDGFTITQSLDILVMNWVELAGSASGHGISDASGWTLGSACVSDDQDNIFVAYSRRVNVPTTIANSGWIYALYVKRYDRTFGVWSGVGGSDTGYGICLTTSGRLISSGWLRDITFHQDTTLGANNKKAVYIAFDGDPDPDPSESKWDCFVIRYNITDGVWEPLGTGTDASDYVTPTPMAGTDDAGGVSLTGNNSRNISIDVDPTTDNIYVAYEAKTASNKDAIYARRFVRATGIWEDVSGMTAADGITDDDTQNWGFPQLEAAGGYVYCAYLLGTSTGNILMQRMNVTTLAWEGPVLIHDTTGGVPPGGEPDVAIDGLNNLWVTYKVTYSGPSDQQVHVVTAPIANWNVPASWTGAGGAVARNVALPMSTVTTAIRAHIAIDSQNRVLAVFNQAHPGMSGSQRNVYVARWDGTSWNGILGSYGADGISNYPDENDWLPWICVDSQDRPIVCWDTFWGPSGGSSNDRRKIYVKTIN